jgi:protein phosphatase
VYHLPQGGRLRQISEDHTHVGWLRRSGKLNEREARNHPRRNVLSQSLGAGNLLIRPQLVAIDAAPGDRLLLCTDGVTEALWDSGIEDLLIAPSGDLAGLPDAERLVRAAVAESGRDNVSAVVIEIGG